ncbi:MAG TPA: VOC family protein [Thermoanaerobaculia bacterium]|nr:VOC family protein [Thermoanaerobaculia bacterium]
MAIKNAIASVAVKDLSAAVEWYERLLGRPADSRPMPEVAEWKFERGGWLQIYQNVERAGSNTVTLAVSSLDEQVSDLTKCGLDAGQPIVSEKVKVVMLKDPDGNSIAFAEAIDPSMAQ